MHEVVTDDSTVEMPSVFFCNTVYVVIIEIAGIKDNNMKMSTMNDGDVYRTIVFNSFFFYVICLSRKLNYDL